MHYRRMERIAKGFANHRRIEILEYLFDKPEASVGDIAWDMGLNIKTASEHIIRLANAGLVMKRSSGRAVRHMLSSRGKNILTFLRKLDR